jgi:hypothetical protein
LVATGQCWNTGQAGDHGTLRKERSPNAEYRDI